MSNTYEYKDFNTIKRFIMYVRKSCTQIIAAGGKCNITDNVEFDINKDKEKSIVISGSFCSSRYKDKWYTFYIRVTFHPVKSEFKAIICDEDDNSVYELYAKELDNQDLSNTFVSIRLQYGFYENGLY